jgi:hypothetical protein
VSPCRSPFMNNSALRFNCILSSVVYTVASFRLDCRLVDDRNEGAGALLILSATSLQLVSLESIWNLPTNIIRPETT